MELSSAELARQTKEIKMRTLLLLLIVSTLGAQVPEPIKDEDKMLIQGLAIQLLQTENRILKLSSTLNKLKVQYNKWFATMLLKYDSKDYVLNAELNWVKKDPALKLKEN